MIQAHQKQASTNEALLVFCIFKMGWIKLTQCKRKINLTSQIKMGSSESRPRKVEFVNTHKNATTTVNILHITMELVNTPTK